MVHCDCASAFRHWRDAVSKTTTTFEHWLSEILHVKERMRGCCLLPNNMYCEKYENTIWQRMADHVYFVQEKSQGSESSPGKQKLPRRKTKSGQVMAWKKNKDWSWLSQVEISDEREMFAAWLWTWLLCAGQARVTLNITTDGNIYLQLLLATISPIEAQI